MTTYSQFIRRGVKSGQSDSSIKSGLLQRKCDKCHKNKPTLQPSAISSAPETVLPIVHEVLRSPGEPLDAATRAYMEPRFAHDFSQVRVHADSRATESAQAVNALAYTVGQHIVFRAGQDTTSTGVESGLLVHELTHVVQQSGADRIGVGQSNEKDVLSPVLTPISSTTPILQRQPAPPSILEQRASRVLADCDVTGGSEERKCNIDQLSKAVIAALSSSPLTYVSISGRTSPTSEDDPSGEAFGQADVMRQALIQWIGPEKFADARFQVGVMDGAEGEPQVEIRIAYRPQVLSDPQTPLLPSPTDPPLPFGPPPKKVGATAVPSPPAGPSRDDPKSAEEKQKDWNATIITGSEKTEDERRADLDKNTIETAGDAILDALPKIPEVKKVMTEKLDPIVDNLPAVVYLGSIPALAGVFAGLQSTHSELPVAKTPKIPISTGKFALGMDTSFQITFRGPANSPTEIAASFTLLKSAYASKLPEINFTLTAKFPKGDKAIGADNPAASQSAMFTLTIPLPGDPKPKK